MNGHMDEPSPSSPLGQLKLENQTRFETELEFVQCLANPHYLASLATQGLLAQPNFVAYLKYLTYWSDPSKGFSRFIVYVGRIGNDPIQDIHRKS
jgi:mediator of RNA polymerase II transcription subunit 31